MRAAGTEPREATYERIKTLIVDISRSMYEIRELAQKPHAPHAAFLHCAKLRGFCPVSSMFL
jgi:hypothetical protein